MLSDSFDDLSKINSQDASLELEKTPIQVTVLQTKGGERRMTNYLHLENFFTRQNLMVPIHLRGICCYGTLEQIEKKRGRRIRLQT